MTSPKKTASSKTYDMGTDKLVPFGVLAYKVVRKSEVTPESSEFEPDS